MFSASKSDHYEKAIATGADAVSADLEDSIPESQKDFARKTLVQWLKNYNPQKNKTVDIHVRINKNSSDFETLQSAELLLKLSAIIIPKVEDIHDITIVTTTFPVIVIIEEAKAVLNIESICAQPNVEGIILGRSDMSRALGLTDRISDLSYIRQKMAVTARAYGKQALDCCHIIRDQRYIRHTWEESASFGITGGACIHPSQVPIAKEVFTPSDSLRKWCEDAENGYRRFNGEPYVAEDGGVIGLPHKRSADRILKR